MTLFIDQHVQNLRCLEQLSLVLIGVEITYDLVCIGIDSPFAVPLLLHIDILVSGFMIMLSLEIKNSCASMLINLLDISFRCGMIALEDFRVHSDWDDKEITHEITTSFVDGTVDDPNFVGILEPWCTSLTKLSSIPMWLLNINPSPRFPLIMDMISAVNISSAVSILQHGIGIFDEYTIAIVGIVIKENVANIWSDRLTKLCVHPLRACFSFLNQSLVVVDLLGIFLEAKLSGSIIGRVVDGEENFELLPDVIKDNSLHLLSNSCTLHGLSRAYLIEASWV